MNAKRWGGSLPTDLVSSIMIYLDKSDLISCAACSKEFAGYALPYIWCIINPTTLQSLNQTLATLTSNRSLYPYGQWINAVELTRLSYEEAAVVDDRMISAFLQNSPYLRRISLKNFPQLTSVSLSIISGSPSLQKRLETFSIATCLSLNATDLYSFFKSIKLPALRSLQLIDMNGVTDSLVHAAATACPSLQELNLRFSGNITDRALQAVAEGCPLLEQLIVTPPHGIIQSNKISDTAVERIAVMCPRLIQFVCRGQTRITSHGVEVLKTRCQMINKVDVSWEYDDGEGELY